MRRIVVLLGIFAGLGGPLSAAAHPGPLFCSTRKAGPQALQSSGTNYSGVMCLPPKWQATGTSQPDTLAIARHALEQARKRAAGGEPQLARMHLRVVEWSVPHLEDRFALERAELLMQEGRYAEACRAFALAEEGPESTTIVKARVGAVQCLLADNDKRAAVALDRLLKQYPELPDALGLRFQLAQARDHWGDVQGAINLYRTIDLHYPGSDYAAQARVRMQELGAQGINIRQLSLTQRIARAERLYRMGPLDLAKDEIRSLLRQRLTPNARGQVMDLARRLSIDDDSETAPGAAEHKQQATAAIEEDEEEGQVDESRERAEQRIRRITRGRHYGRLNLLQLRVVLKIAIAAGLKEHVDKVLDSVTHTRRRILPAYRFQMAVLAAGVAPELRVMELLEPLMDDRRYGMAAKYHYARALERLGRLHEAEKLFHEVMKSDSSDRRYYAMWAEQRLWTVRQALGKRPGGSSGARASAKLASAALMAPADDDESHLADPPRPRRDDAALAETAAQVSKVAANHQEAYPWLQRAADLIALGEHEAASDELHEAYQAWRAAMGRRALRAGLVSVYKGRSVRLGWPSVQVRRARRMLSETDRRVLARAAAALGDYGTAIGWGGWSQFDELPRAHEDAVRKAAARHHLDPNLLLAVMRVESVYQRRIISYAGAMGLMQIMPRTGMLIAQNMGKENFTVEKLLQPETNIEFAAWYLASLLRRFEGSLPLAIAGYNGGPHNVRKWLKRHPADMPLDVFLEHIPFSQTHRYVRRVLTYYAHYRQQQGKPMVYLSTQLPTIAGDGVGF